MKKVLIVAVMVLAVFFTTSCAKKETEKSAGKLTKDTIKVGFVYIGTINDEGYTEAHDQGRLALNEMGIETAYIENVPENADCEKAIRDLIDLGCNVIYTTSFGFMDWTIRVAADHPEIYFGHCSGYRRAANVSTFFGKIYQARYLSGIVAGMKTKVNKIGYVAAMQIPEVIRGINAFALGVQSVNPSATVEVIWTNTWFDPAVEKQAALELLNKGCDIIAQHQDTTAPQIAAQEKGAFAIGYNSPTANAAPKAYLTAPLFHWEVFYVDDVNKILDGTWVSRAYWEGLDTGMVSLDELTINCAPGTAEAVDTATNAIIAGDLHPFAGPLYDQSGTEKVGAGIIMTDDEIWNMSWFVKGVIGNISN
ncbi:BMP family ABC transporter substrate-binding protein [Brucepastera parasyntrophica]|uniref:BMP family ABC transporter substrate-binding protein n=1 Tax=Brucepastera parasyntrophica TaxID=2880008 RepID=UPI0021098D04|nr:BMP family ABC transporter substrate-binding protein [Brucepastera parasyntrophica]ULQ60921.1 BMP family ABC transporter substrate-binding protein [Brucepastera parasyntrophica]